MPMLIGITAGCITGGQGGGASGPVFDRPQVLLLTGDSQAKGTIVAADQSAAVARYVGSSKAKISDAINTTTVQLSQYAPGTKAGIEFSSNQGMVGSELKFIERFRARYPNDDIIVIKESASGSYQVRAPAINAGATSTISSTGNTNITLNSGGALQGNHILADTSGSEVEVGVYYPGFANLCSVNGGGRTGPAFTSQAVTQHNGTISWSVTEGLVYGGSSGATTNGVRARVAAALALLTNPQIACHIHILGTNDRALTSAPTFATDYTAFLNKINTDLAAYDANTKINLVRPQNAGGSATTVRAAIAAEAGSRANSVMIDMDGKPVQVDATHWDLVSLDYIGETAFTNTYGV